MVKSSIEKLEQDKKKILKILMNDAKENIDTIAKRCGFSRQKTWRLIKHLEENKLIWGYTAIIDEEKIGLKHYMVLLKRSTKSLPTETADRIVSRRGENILTEIGGNIETSALIHGDYDWFVSLTAKDIVQAKKYTDTLIRLHPNEIDKVTLLQTMLFIKKQNILNPRREQLKEFI